MKLLWRWEAGRQGGDYKKFLLATSRRLHFDVYLLYFPEGSEVREHTDPVDEGWTHHRLNIVLRRSIYGGNVVIRYDGSRLKRLGRVMYLRPDVQSHMMTKCQKGSQLMLSIGWKRKNK